MVGAEPPPWSLWRFAWQACPLLCRAYGRFATADTVGALGYVQAERRALTKRPHAQPGRLAQLIQAECDLRLRQMRKMATRLILHEIPNRVRRRLAAGGYEVTYTAEGGARAIVPSEILNTLSIDLAADRLSWPAQTFEGVMVKPAPGSLAAATEPAAVVLGKTRAGNTGGRPPKWDWDAFAREMVRLANHPDGLPDRNDLAKQMAKWCVAEWGDEPADSTLRDKISRLYPGDT